MGNVMLALACYCKSANKSANGLFNILFVSKASVTNLVIT